MLDEKSDEKTKIKTDINTYKQTFKTEPVQNQILLYKAMGTILLILVVPVILYLKQSNFKKWMVWDGKVFWAAKQYILTEYGKASIVCICLLAFFVSYVLFYYDKIQNKKRRIDKLLPELIFLNLVILFALLHEAWGFEI